MFSDHFDLDFDPWQLLLNNHVKPVLHSYFRSMWHWPWFLASILEQLRQTNISNIICHMIVYHCVTECHILFLGQCNLDPWPQVEEYCVQSISPTLIKVGFCNSMCGCLFWSQNNVYCFLVTMKFTLISGLSSRKIVSGIYYLYYLSMESQFGFVNKFPSHRVSYNVSGSLWNWLLVSDLEKSCLEHTCYLRQDFQILLCRYILGSWSVAYSFQISVI